jgi:hypothetical protein
MPKSPALSRHTKTHNENIAYERVTRPSRTPNTSTRRYLDATFDLFILPAMVLY